MKSHHIGVIALVLGSVSFIGSPLMAQDEYDDMYFNGKDRKTVSSKTEKSMSAYAGNDQVMAKNTNSESINATYDPEKYGEITENYSSKNVNPEYIARYKSNPKENNVEGDDSYYVENIDRELEQTESSLNNATNRYAYPSSFEQYYPYMGYNSMARMDPFYGHSAMGPRWNLSMRYGFGYMPGWSMSMGYGSGFSTFYDPWFYDPWMMSPYYSMYNPYGFYGPAYWDPFFSPYGNPYRYSSFGARSYSGWGYYNYSSCGNSYVFSMSEQQRNRMMYDQEHQKYLTRGRETNVNRRTDVVNVRNDSEASKSQRSNARTTDNNTRVSREYSRVQNEYYTQSRTSQNARSTSRSSYTGNNSRSTSSDYLSRSSSRSTGNGLDYSRPSYKSSREQSTMGSSNYSRTSSRSSNSSGYRSSSSSRSSGFSSPSYSSGSSYSGSRSSSSSSSSSGSGGSSGASRSGRGK